MVYIGHTRTAKNITPKVLPDWSGWGWCGGAEWVCMRAISGKPVGYF